MTDVVEAPAVDPAPQADVTATPAAPTGGPEPVEILKTFTQADVDGIVAKRLAREERKWQREADRRVAEIARTPAPQPTQAPTKPQAESFTSTEQYVEALAEWKANEIFQKRSTETEKQVREHHARQEAEALTRSLEEREASAREKYADYDDVTRNPSLPITEHMAQTIALSETGPELAYHLGKNPQEAARISRLSPFLQAKELGRIEAKLAETPTPVTTSKAPPPIKPVSGKAPIASEEPSDKDDIDTWRKKRERQLYGKSS